MTREGEGGLSQTEDCGYELCEMDVTLYAVAAGLAPTATNPPPWVALPVALQTGIGRPFWYIREMGTRCVGVGDIVDVPAPSVPDADVSRSPV